MTSDFLPLLCIQHFLFPAPVACKNLLSSRLNFCKIFLFQVYLISFRPPPLPDCTEWEWGRFVDSFESEVFTEVLFVYFRMYMWTRKLQVLLIYGTEALFFFLVEVKLLSRVLVFATPWMAGHQASPSMGFSRQEYWSGLSFPLVMGV